MGLDVFQKIDRMIVELEEIKKELWRLTSMKTLPISAAGDVAKKYGLDQVILVAWDSETGEVYAVSYGKDKVNCKQAAEGVSFVKKSLGFSEKECWAEEVEPKTGLNAGDR